MVSGSSKLRKRKGKKAAPPSSSDPVKVDDEEVIDMFGIAEKSGQSDFEFPMPPSMSKQPVQVETEDDEDEDDDEEEEEEKPMKKGVTIPKKDKEIKMLPVIFLFLMFGTTLIPAFVFLGDSMSGYFKNSNLFGEIGSRLGLGPVPRKRMLSFYEKHNPEKLADVPTVLSKYYGDYPKLIRKLERKYQDYGYFVGWEEDEAPIRVVRESMEEAYSIWIQEYWNKHAPQSVRNRVRNVQFNLNKLYKMGRKLWKRTIWPALEPFLGVPDQATAEKQKRKDAREARKQQSASSSSSGRRRRNTEYRDED